MLKKLLLTFFLLILTGCSAPNPPLFIMYPDAPVIKEQANVATIITAYAASIDDVDYMDVTRVFNEKYDEELWAYDVLGGEHVLSLTYTPVSYSRTTIRSYNYSSTDAYRTTYRKTTVYIKYNFEAGNVYWATIKGSYLDGTNHIHIDKGFPADKTDYRKSGFDVGKVIENIQKTRAQASE